MGVCFTFSDEMWQIVIVVSEFAHDCVMLYRPTQCLKCPPRKFKDQNIKYIYRDPQKAHPWPERRLLTYFS